MTERTPWDFAIPNLQPGDRVAWVDSRGVTHADIVADHREDPPGSGNYVIETEGAPRWSGRRVWEGRGSAVPVAADRSPIPLGVWAQLVSQATNEDAAPTEPHDILDDIDAVLAEGEPETGFDFGDPTYPRCPRGCGRHWHGMAVTSRIEAMRYRGAMDPDYRYDQDDSEVLCPAPDFIGPHRPPRYVPAGTKYDGERAQAAARAMDALIAQLSVALLPGFRRIAEAAYEIFGTLDSTRDRRDRRGDFSFSSWEIIAPPQNSRQLLPEPLSFHRWLQGDPPPRPRAPRPSPAPYPPEVLDAINQSIGHPLRMTHHRWLIGDPPPTRGASISHEIIDEGLPEPDPVAEAAAATIARPEPDPTIAARAALEDRPIRIPGARPIPSEPDPDPVQQAVSRAIRTNRRRR